MSKKTVVLTAAIAGLVGVGVGVGAAGSSGAETAEPQVCVDAINEGDNVIGIAYDGFVLFEEFAYLSAQAVTAAAEWDIPTMDALAPQLDDVNAGLSGLTAELEQSDYRTLADECLASQRGDL